MIKFFLKLAFVIVVGLVLYNYFLGSPDEKAQSRELISKAKDLTKDAWNLLQSEHTKMQDGKYDEVTQKLEGLMGELKTVAKNLQDSEALQRLEELNERRSEVEELIRNENDEPSQQTKRKLENLTRDTEELVNEMEAKSRSTPPY